MGNYFDEGQHMTTTPEITSGEQPPKPVSPTRKEWDIPGVGTVSVDPKNPSEGIQLVGVKPRHVLSRRDATSLARALRKAADNTVDDGVW